MNILKKVIIRFQIFNQMITNKINHIPYNSKKRFVYNLCTRVRDFYSDYNVKYIKLKKILDGMRLIYSKVKFYQR